MKRTLAVLAIVFVACGETESDPTPGRVEARVEDPYGVSWARDFRYFIIETPIGDLPCVISEQTGAVSCGWSEMSQGNG